MTLIIADRVKETSTTTGTGALTLAGAMAGHKAFSARCSVGDTCHYCIQAVDSAGQPTGDWEVGLGTYSAASTLTRTTVLASSNADAAVSLAAGTKQVYITLPAAQAKWMREKLTADRTYYVRTDGNDANTGLANSAGGAFLTIQKAVDVAAQLDSSIYNVTIQLGAGTYTGNLVARSMVGAGTITIVGDTTTPSNVVLTVSSGILFLSSNNPTVYNFRGVKFTGTGTANRVLYALNATVQFGLVEFGAGFSNCHLFAVILGRIVCTDAYTISGGGLSHAYAANNAYLQISGYVCTLTGSPAFSSAFVTADTGAVVYAATASYSGTATGPRYLISMNAAVQTGGLTLPGSTAGSTATGGQYA